MNGYKSKLILLALAVMVLVIAGCNNDILDPTQLGRFRPVPAVNVILDSLGVADEPAEQYAGAEEPRPEDLVDYEGDYRFGVGDIVRITVYELYLEGATYVGDFRVSETGRVSIPDVGQVQVAGLTESELEEEIRNIVYPSKLKDPSITVLMLSSESRYYSIIGQGVFRPSRYPVPQYTFRLSDAIALAGGVGEHNVSYIYISRDVKGGENEVYYGGEAESTGNNGEIELKAVEPADSVGAGSQDQLLEMITPYAGAGRPDNQIVISTSEMVTEDELELLANPEGVELKTSFLSRDVTAFVEEAPVEEEGRIEWVYEDGKWNPVRVGGEVMPREQASTGIERKVESGGGDYGLQQIGEGGVAIRVIQIPVDKLLSGDPRYDIVIRPGDRLTVPVDIIGECWVSGNVNSSGVIDLTGRPMTLKMVIAAAGGLNALAWPKKVEVVRRLGKNKAGLMQEEIVMVDLNKISKGLQPDFFIKPYDLINVGTHGTSRWLAVLRNAFRATYGFGFIYDRNFASRDFNNDPFPGHISLNNIF